MTDKQIIIDGVDVSGCPQYCGYDTCKNTCHYFCTPCEWVDIKNCNYKRINLQLQAKEQEYEELTSKCSQLKQTLAEIKEIIHFNKTNRLSGGGDISIEQILQIINEVDNELQNRSLRKDT